jgi:hypothetical protein
MFPFVPDIDAERGHTGRVLQSADLLIKFADTLRIAPNVSPIPTNPSATVSHLKLNQGLL